MDILLDIYFLPEYGEICRFVEPGVCETYCLENEYGCIKNMFIKRPVPWLIEGEQYYDIITPYGYGGPIVLETSDQESLVSTYLESFGKYCIDNRIVSEFIRYHPIYRNWEPFKDIYNNIYSRHTVGTNLRDYDDPVQSEFSKSARKEIRKAINAGVKCKPIPCPENLDTFRRLYEETMDRNHAEPMYYFPDEYYHLLETVLRPYVLILEAEFMGEIIASELYFTAGKHLHAHLLGSNDKLLELSGGSLIEATAAQWGRDNGFFYIHHGGGRTSAEDDPLYLYKKKFGKNTEFDFYIGKKIWNEEVYNKLVDLRMKEKTISDPQFFPQYRG